MLLTVHNLSLVGAVRQRRVPMPVGNEHPGTLAACRGQRRLGYSVSGSLSSCLRSIPAGGFDGGVEGGLSLLWGTSRSVSSIGSDRSMPLFSSAIRDSFTRQGASPP